MSSVDNWADWILNRRHGGDPAELERTLARVGKIRDRVLANGEVAAGDTLLDVGTGDGLIAFGALAYVGASGRVILSDISHDLLDHARHLANQMDVARQCTFVHASADDLSAIADESVDVITTRSVLAYVENKPRAFAEFARVLRPDGRISHYEPINRLTHPEPEHRFDGYDVTPVQDLAHRINAVFGSRQPIGIDPMFDFDERDLVGIAQAAGFGEVHLELHVDVTPHVPQRWEVYAGSAANPLAPTLIEAMEEALAADERVRFVAHLQPRVEQGDGTFSVATAYLWGARGRSRASVPP